MGLNPKAMNDSRRKDELNKNRLALKILMNILTLWKIKRTECKQSEVISMKKNALVLVVLVC
jgi:hypothetical protein